MATMRVVQVTRPNGPFETVEREIPQPGAGSVRVKVDVCGICHSDSVTKEGTFPFDRAAEAYEHMMSGKARFRVVLTIGR